MVKMKQLKQFLSVKDASELTTLAKSTLYTYVHYKKIPYCKVGERIVFEKDKLVRFMKRKNKNK
jgi:excisionase family DNA binding protein